MNRLLARQLKRLSIDTEKGPEDIEQWAEFLRVIDEAYEQNEQDRYLLERSLEISSKEMSERFKNNRELNLQLAQTSKLASLGTLASGIAHELNNPLQGIKGYIEITVADQFEVESTKINLDRIKRLTERMSDTIKLLLKLSRSAATEGEKTGISITESIQETLELLSNQTGFDEIKFNLNNHCAQQPHVLAEQNQMFTLFQNLFSNSRDAFSKISEHQENTIDISIEENETQIMINYIDNAGGISPDILPKIFDPFFTTKDVGSGTGLGLALCRTTVESIGGTITAHVEENKTFFKVTLPKYDILNPPNARAA